MRASRLQSSHAPARMPYVAINVDGNTTQRHERTGCRSDRDYKSRNFRHLPWVLARHDKAERATAVIRSTSGPRGRGACAAGEAAGVLRN